MNRIPIAIVGLGFGKYIVDQIVSGSGREYFKLIAVCDARHDLVSNIAADHGCLAYTSLDALLENQDIRTVALITGPVGRAGLITQIVDSGRDVMTTKPLELDPAAAEKALTHAGAIGRTVHLNSPSPLLPPELQQVKIWESQFNLGRPIGCRRDVWGSYTEEADGSWYDDPDLCPVAPIYRLGIYLINDIVRLLGPAERVSIMESRIRTGRPTSDNGQLGIQFKSGVLANIFASFCVGDGDHYRNALTLNFEHGTVYGNAGPVRNHESGFDISLVAPVNGTREIVASEHFDTSSGLYDWATFAAAVNGTPLPGAITPAEAIEGLRVIVAMKAALKSGGTAFV